MAENGEKYEKMGKISGTEKTGPKFQENRSRQQRKKKTTKPVKKKPGSDRPVQAKPVQRFK